MEKKALRPSSFHLHEIRLFLISYCNSILIFNFAVKLDGDAVMESLVFRSNSNLNNLLFLRIILFQTRYYPFVFAFIHFATFTVSNFQ